MLKREVKFKVGRESQPGTVSLSPFMSELLTLSVSYKGERAASVTLTREQVRQLKEALAAIDKEAEAGASSITRDLKLAA